MCGVLNFGPQEVLPFVASIFDTMLGLPVTASEDQSLEPTGGLTAAVQFLGVDQGALLFHCTTQQSLHLAHRMLGEDLESLRDEDVRDVLGELANVIGGNLKSLFAPGAALSLPMVAEGQDYTLCLCPSNPVMKLTFESEIGPLYVTLVRFMEENVHARVLQAASQPVSKG